jgi:proteic killer suppression protein
MEITFSDEDLQALCLHSRIAVKQLGQPCARKLQSRLADLDAASCVAELIAGRPHPLKGARRGEFAVDLYRGFRLVFAPNHNPLPEREGGGIDWSRVTCVRITFIGDYHD